MPNIKPISDLRNYTEVLKQVKLFGITTTTQEKRQADSTETSLSPITYFPLIW